MNPRYDVSAATIGKVVRTLLERNARKATAFISPTLTVKASRVLFNKKIYGSERRADIVLTIGEPNYAERRFIQQCKKAGEPLPVKKIQLKAVPNA